jgi:hypothetical protein
MDALEEFGNFKIGGKVIYTAKYAEEPVLLIKEEMVLQDMIDKLIEIGRCYGTEMNVEITNLMRISKQPFPVKIIIVQKQLKNVETFKYLGRILKNDGRRTCEIKRRIAMAKVASTRRGLFLLTHWTWN